jgi:hypothetical protein
MIKYLKRLAVGGGAALAFCVLWVPVTAEAAKAPVAPTATAASFTTSATYAQTMAQFAALPAPTASEYAVALAYAKAHPMQGTGVLIPPPSTGSSLGAIQDVGGGVYWWGVRLYLSQNDVHNIWVIVATVGLGGAALILCSPGVWLALFCSIVGAVVGYIVAEIIWNYVGSYARCGLTIDIPWTLRWSFRGC